MTSISLRTTPRLGLRGRVWLRRSSLDRLLAEGAAPTESKELALRAHRLTSERTRGSLAIGLERVVEAAEEPVRPLTSSVPLRRDDILQARERILELAAELRASEPVRPRGAALVSLLLTDGASPLYSPPVKEDLDSALCRARVALTTG